MVTFLQVKNGIYQFLQSELVNKISGWQKWVIGAGLSMYMEKGVDVFNALKNHPLVQALNIIDPEDNIDIDTVYTHFLKQAQAGAVTFKLPMIGDVTLKADDVDKLYRLIKE